MPNKPKMIEAICPVCSNTFVAARHELVRGKRKYCSESCRKKVTSSGFEDTTCYFCHSVFIRRVSQNRKTKSGVYFCSKKCKYDAASSYDCDYSTGPHGKKGIYSYRTRAIRLLPNRCVRCNYSDLIELLDVDHIDSNRQNGCLTNLQILCVMCHALKTRRPDLFFSDSLNQSA